MPNGWARDAALRPRAPGSGTPRAPMPRNSANAPPPRRLRRQRRRGPSHPPRPMSTIPTSPAPMNTPMQDQRQWPLYEVFVRARGGLDHKHVGSLHAADARMAIDHARDLYTRRQEGISIWVVPSKDITASDPR